MAVSNVSAPNLSSNYENIIQQLQRRGDISQQQGQNANGMGVANAIAKPLEEQTAKWEDFQKQKSLDVFKASLEDQLAEHRAQYGATAEGRIKITPDHVSELETEMAKEMGKPPDYYKGQLNSLVGTNQKPEEMQDYLSTADRIHQIEQTAQQIESSGKPEDKVKANVLRLVGRDKNADSSVIPRIMGMSQPMLRNNPVDGLTHLYDKLSGQDMGAVPTSIPSGSGVPQADSIPALRRLDTKQAEALDSAGKSTLTDSNLKAAGKVLDDLEQTEKLVKANVPGSQINIGADTARAIGGVPGGRFSSLMAVSEGKDPSISGKIGQYVETRLTGKNTENNQKLLLQELAVAKAHEQEDLKTTLEDRVNQARIDAPYASDKLIRTRISGGYARFLKEVSKPKTVVQNGHTYTLNESTGQYE